MPAEALTKLREKYPVYKDIPDQELAQKIVGKYPEYKDLLGDIAEPPKQEPPTPEPSALGKGYHALTEGVAKAGQYGPLDLVQLGLSKTGLGMPTLRPAATDEQAQRYSDVVTPILLTAAGGAGAGALAQGTRLAQAAPAIGRVATAMGESAAQADLKGEKPGGRALTTGVLDAATEALLSKTGLNQPLIRKLPGAAARAFRAVAEKLEPALEAVKDRLPTGVKFSVPTLGKGLMTAEEAVKKLAEVTPTKFAQARNELIKAMNALTTKRAVAGPAGTAVREEAAGAGDLFESMTGGKDASRFAPPLMSRAFDAIITSPVGKAVLDTPTGVAAGALGGVPFGAAGAALAAGKAQDNAGHLVRSLLHF